jgi:hypothetical protein
MTRLLERAFKEASKLPEVERSALAKWDLEEPAMEMKVPSPYLNDIVREVQTRLVA